MTIDSGNRFPWKRYIFIITTRLASTAHGFLITNL